MIDEELLKIKRGEDNYTGNRSVQTGFPSPATHYREPMVDLNKELSSSRDATFFVRVRGNTWKHLNILDQDVLIIDKSQKPQRNQLALVIASDSFHVIRIADTSLNTYTLWGVITYIIHKAV